MFSFSGSAGECGDCSKAQEVLETVPQPDLVQTGISFNPHENNYVYLLCCCGWVFWSTV